MSHQPSCVQPLVCYPLSIRDWLPKKHGTALPFSFEVGRDQGGLDPGPDPITTGRRMAQSQVKLPNDKATRTKNASTNKTRQNIKLKSDGDCHGSNVILNVIMQPLCEGMILRDLLAQQLHCVYPGVQKVME